MKFLTIGMIIFTILFVECEAHSRVGDVRSRHRDRHRHRHYHHSRHHHGKDKETKVYFYPYPAYTTYYTNPYYYYYYPYNYLNIRTARHVLPEDEKRIENYSCTKRGIANDPNAESKTQWGVCSKYWVYCAAPEARPDILSCPADLRFDQEQELCLSEEYVFGCSGERRSPPVAAPVQLDDDGNPVESPVKPAPDGFCNEQEDGFYPLLQGQCSPEYVACVDEEGSILECPKGQAYFVEKERCEFVENLPECGGSRPIFDESSLEKEKETLPPPFTCDKEGIVLDPRPEAITQWGVCSQTWFYCPGAELPPDTLSCPADLYFDTELSLCIKKKHIYSCTGKIPKSTTTTSPIPAPPAVEPVFVEQSKPFVEQSKPFVEQSKPFVEQNKPFEQPSKPLEDSLSVNDFCSEQPDGSYEWQGRCSPNFAICNGHLGYLISCPDLTLYNPTTSECVPSNECN